MLKKHLFGVSAVALVGLASIVTACDGDDTMAGDGGTSSSGGLDATVDSPVITPDATPNNDAQVDAGPKGNAARLNFVNDQVVGPHTGYRFCALGTTDGSLPGPANVVGGSELPFPNKTFPWQKQANPLPGLTVGRGSRAPELASSYEKMRMRFVAYFVGTGALEDPSYKNLTCAQLVAKSAFRTSPKPVGDAGVSDAAQTFADAGAGALQEGLDFDVVGDFPAGTFKDKMSYALIMQGCSRSAPTDEVADGLCPGFVPGFGSLDIMMLELDQTKAAAGKNGAQLIMASQRTVSVGIDTLGANLVFPGGDAGTRTALAPTGVKFKMSGKADPVPPVTVASLKTLSGFEVDDLNGFLIPGTAADIEEVSDLKFSNATDMTPYTFVIVNSPFANPLEDNGARNYYSMHAVAIPND